MSTENRRRWLDVLIAGSTLVFLDVCLFHFGAYKRWIEPQSYSGRLARLEQKIEQKEKDTGVDLVVIGDSTGRSAIQEGLLSAELRNQGASFESAVNLSLGGMKARSLFYTWRELASRAQGTVVIAFNHVLLANRSGPSVELSTIKTKLRVSDAVSLARSMSSIESKARASAVSFWRAPLFKEDLVGLLREPRKRLAALSSAGPVTWPDEIRSERSLGAVARARHEGATTMPRTWLDDYPAERARVMRRIDRQVQGRASQVVIDEGQLKFLTKLVGRLEQGGHEVVFAILPSTAFPVGKSDQFPASALESALEELGQSVAVFHDLGLLSELEMPEFFRDSLHLNKKGADRYTVALANWLTTR